MNTAPPRSVRARPLHEDPRIHARRWFLLAMMCLSLVLVVMSVSGALLERFWWGSAILVNLPVVLATFVAIWVFAPESRDDEHTPLDPIGALLSLVGLSALVFAIIQGGEDGWTTTSVVGAAALALVTLTAFVLWERRSAHPTLPLTFFRDRRFTQGSVVVTVAFF